MSSTPRIEIGSITAQAVLDALDGVAYLVAPDGTLLAVGGRTWTPFAEANGAPALEPRQVVGRSLFEMIEGTEVRDVYRRLHEAVRTRRRPNVTFDYRCDAPALRREMRLSISPVEAGGALVALLYQSQVKLARVRPEMSLFLPELRLGARKPYSDERLVSLCDFCHRVAWPIGPPRHGRRWIEPEDYYRRGGPADMIVSHGICPDCHARVEEAGAPDEATA
ncbi:MAG: hypothetical protein IT561_20255 [Alphaproteobacteria bacterium]|nr:hypothetical protein [Alphaproteobacteria bacterium]